MAGAGGAEEHEMKRIENSMIVGLALTFGLVAISPTPHGRRRWALFPAGVLFVMALSGMAFTGAALGVLWPALLIVAGLYLAYRAVRMPQPELIASVPAPAANVPAGFDERPALESEAASSRVTRLSHDDVRPWGPAVGVEKPLETAHKEAV